MIWGRGDTNRLVNRDQPITTYIKTLMCQQWLLYADPITWGGGG